MENVPIRTKQYIFSRNPFFLNRLSRMIIIIYFQCSFFHENILFAGDTTVLSSTLNLSTDRTSLSQEIIKNGLASIYGENEEGHEIYMGMLIQGKYTVRNIDI